MVQNSVLDWQESWVSVVVQIVVVGDGPGRWWLAVVQSGGARRWFKTVVADGADCSTTKMSLWDTKKSIVVIDHFI